MMRRILSVVLSLTVFSAAFAQEKSTHSFSLKEAVDYAIDNNISAKNAKLDEQKAKAFNWEIVTQGLPQINASVEYDYYFKTPEVPALNKFFSDTASTFSKLIQYYTGPNSPDQNIKNILLPSLTNNSNSISFVLPHTLSTGLQATQLLFDARYLFGIRARKDLYKTSRLSTSLTEQDIRYTIIKAYYQAAAAQESKGLLQENITIVNKLLDDTRAIYNQGLTEELDVNRLELAQSTLQSQINFQNQMAEVALSNLKFQMGLPLGDELILKDKLDDLKAALNLSTENKFDAQSRPEYALLQTAITLKGYDVAQKRSGYYPSLAGFVNYGWTAQTEKFGDIFKSENQPNPDGTFKKVNAWYSQGLVGLKLNIPIFDSGLKMAQVKQAKIEQLKAINSLENFKNAAQLQFQVAQSSLTNAVADEVTSQKTLDLSKKIFTVNQAKFKQGVVSSFELQQSQQEYATNQLKHMQSLLNLLNAKADLDKSLGVK